MLPVEHALPTPGHHPWRTIAVVVAGIATLELLGLVVVGTALVAKPVAEKARAAASKPANAHKTPARPILPRRSVRVTVLNGNGIAGAAATEAARVRAKPFANTPRESARLLIDFGYVLQLLDLRPGMSLCELGCGPGWMTRFAARHGVQAEGYDISPDMIAIARELAAEEGLDVHFEAADMEELDLGRRFDAGLLYDALHHSPRADLVLATAHRALKPGGRLLLAEPNWKPRFH